MDGVGVEIYLNFDPQSAGFLRFEVAPFFQRSYGKNRRLAAQISQDQALVTATFQIGRA